MPGALGLLSGLRFRRISALPPVSSRGTGSRGSGIHSMSASLGDRADEARRIEGGSVRGEADQVVGLLEPHFADNRNDSALFFNKEYSRAVEQCRNALQSNPLFSRPVSPWDSPSIGWKGTRKRWRSSRHYSEWTPETSKSGNSATPSKGNSRMKGKNKPERREFSSRRFPENRSPAGYPRKDILILPGPDWLPGCVRREIGETLRIGFPLCLLPARAKKFGEKVRALLADDPGDHHRPVVHPLVGGDQEPAVNGPRLGIERPENDLLHPGVDGRPRAHRAGLESHHPIGSFFFRCLSKRVLSSSRPLCFGGGSIFPTPLPPLPRATPHPAAFRHPYTRDGMGGNPRPTVGPPLRSGGHDDPPRSEPAHQCAVVGSGPRQHRRCYERTCRLRGKTGASSCLRQFLPDHGRVSGFRPESHHGGYGTPPDQRLRNQQTDRGTDLQTLRGEALLLRGVPADRLGSRGRQGSRSRGGILAKREVAERRRPGQDIRELDRSGACGLRGVFRPVD